MRKKVSVSVFLTDHAAQRIRERLGLNNGAAEKMVLRAYVNGKKHAECKGLLKKYVDEIYSRKQTCNNIRIYGEVIFLFAGNKLVTVYQLPNELKALAKK